MSRNTQKILVQWLASEDLQIERRLTIGTKAGAEVQREGIKLHSHPEAFPRAMALATLHADGLMTLQVGFRGDTRFDGEGWVLTAPAQPAPGRTEVFYFDHAPTHDELLERAEGESSYDPARLKARRIAMERICIQVREDYDRLTAEATKNRAPSPFFSIAAFNELAKVCGTETLNADGSEKCEIADEEGGDVEPPTTP